MQFPSSWLQMIMQCVSTVSYQVQLNGHLSTPFLPSRGLRQGDPLSPYLFILCANIFSAWINDLQQTSYWKPLKVAQKATALSHLMYADDTLLFFQATPQQASLVNHVIHEYGRLSGLKINNSKSVLLFSSNVSVSTKHDISEIIQVKYKPRLRKYLGIHVDYRIKAEEIFQELRGRLQSKLEGWGKLNLSQAGRLVLIKSVASSMLTYQLSCYKLSEHRAGQLDSMCSNFFWGEQSQHRNLHCLAWGKLCRSKAEGGLGIKRFGIQNQVLLAKHLWRVISNSDNYFVNRIMGHKIISSEKCKLFASGSGLSQLWRGIFSSKKNY